MRIGDYYVAASWADYSLAGLKIGIFGLLLAIFWWLVNRVTHFDDHEELFVKRNSSYLTQRCGLLLGQGVAMWPLLGSTGRLGFDLAWLVGGGLWTMLLLGLLWPVLNRLIGHGEMTDPQDTRERALSLVRAAFFVASGLVIGAGLSGSAPSLAAGIASTVGFTLLGLAVLYAAYRINARVPLFDHLGRHLANGNLSAGIIAAGFTLALGLVLNKAIAGDFAGWVPSLLGFAVTAVAAVIGFYVVSWLMDMLIITSASLRQVVREDQHLAAVVTATMLVTVAIAVAALPV
jgi:uncharacterized membrane protein YjfL (UPF0719 family)